MVASVVSSDWGSVVAIDSMGSVVVAGVVDSVAPGSSVPAGSLVAGGVVSTGSVVSVVGGVVSTGPVGFGVVFSGITHSVGGILII